MGHKHASLFHSSYLHYFVSQFRSASAKYLVANIARSCIRSSFVVREMIALISGRLIYLEVRNAIVVVNLIRWEYRGVGRYLWRSHYR